MSLFDIPKGTRRKVKFNPKPAIPKTTWTKDNHFPDLSGAKAISFDVETYDPDLVKYGPGWGRGRGHIVGIALGTDDGFQHYYPIRHEDEKHDNYDIEQVLDYARKQLSHPHQRKVGHNTIYDVGWLEHEGVPVVGKIWDTMIAERLLDYNEPASLEATASRYGIEGKSSKDLYKWLFDYYGQSKVASSAKKLREVAASNFYRCPPRLIGSYAESDVRIPIQVAKRQHDLLRRAGLADVFDLECRLIPVLVSMRLQGVRVDLDKAERAYDEIKIEIGNTQRRIDGIAGMTGVETGSPVAMEKVFKKLNLRSTRTANGKVSLSKESLSAIHHPIVKEMVDLAELEKYNSTFIESYILNSNVNGIVYGQFDAMGAITGRMSCVHKDTEIPTETRGLQKIINLLPIDRVFTHKGRWRRVEKLIIKPVSDMFKVTFSNGSVLHCTGEHRLLTNSGKWVSLRDVCIKETTKRSDFIGRNNKDLLQLITDSKGSWSETRGYRTYSSCDMQTGYTEGDIHNYAEASLLSVENWRQESDARENRKTPPQLQGELLGLQGLLDENCGWETLFRSQNCNGEEARNARQGFTVEHGSSSHRREPSQQSHRQFGTLHQSCSQRNPREVSKVIEPVRITGIEYGGSHTVYDITVEEDSSYLCCGVFNHNSKNPNLQNLPSKNDLAKVVREIFVPHEGHDFWRKYDYASIENRVFAEYAVGGAGEKLRQQYIDQPLTDYHNWCLELVAPYAGWDISTPDKYKNRRKPIKNINFGIVYGMGIDKLAVSLGIPRAEAEILMASYHDALPHVKQTMDYLADQADKRGFSETILGRKVKFDMWEPNEWSANPLPPLPRNRALSSYGFNIRKSGLYKATNYTIQGSAADLMKMAMVQCWEQGIFAVTGVPVMTVHDELDFSDAGGNDDAFLEMKYVMETAIEMRVPIVVDGEIGTDWANLRDI